MISTKRNLTLLSLVVFLGISPSYSLHSQTAPGPSPSSMPQRNVATIDSLCSEYRVDGFTCNRIKQSYDPSKQYVTLFDDLRDSFAKMDIVTAVLQIIGKSSTHDVGYEVSLSGELYIHSSAFKEGPLLKNPGLELRYGKDDELIISSIKGASESYLLRLNASRTLTATQYQAAKDTGDQVTLEEWNQGFAFAYALASDALRRVEALNKGWKQKSWKTKPTKGDYNKGFTFPQEALPYQPKIASNFHALTRIGPGEGGFVFFSSKEPSTPTNRLMQYLIEEKVAAYRLDAENLIALGVTYQGEPCAYHQVREVSGFSLTLGRNTLHDLVHDLYGLGR